MARVSLSTVDGLQLDMYELDIRSSNSTYKVRVIDGHIEFKNGEDYYLADVSVQSIIDLSKVEDSKVIWIEGSEQTKTIAYCGHILEELAARGANKKSKLIAIGGGSIQDVATLTASLYMRGMSWTYIPSTFMAMTDSCIGGKSAINVGRFKNLAGNFYPPSEILINEIFLSTLSKSAIASGLIEAVKIQIARDKSEFVRFLDAYNEYKRNNNLASLIEIAKMTLESKKWFVEIDEFDKKERKLLNYGHSFGHALESASGMTIPHGLAVGVGILVANQVISSTPYSKAIDSTVKDILRNSNFDFSTLVVAKKNFTDALILDKKNSKTEQVLILLNDYEALQTTSRGIKSETLDSQWFIFNEVIKELGDLI
jgi:3-dehydroquinate synthase